MLAVDNDPTRHAELKRRLFTMRLARWPYGHIPIGCSAQRGESQILARSNCQGRHVHVDGTVHDVHRGARVLR